MEKPSSAGMPCIRPELSDRNPVLVSPRPGGVKGLAVWFPFGGLFDFENLVNCNAANIRHCSGWPPNFDGSDGLFHTVAEMHSWVNGRKRSPELAVK
jgi:hypothetical protein